jgi:hypothetical protein
MTEQFKASQDSLVEWLLRLLEREENPWNKRQSSYLRSLLRTPEGARTLARMATTCVRLRTTGYEPTQMGKIGSVYVGLEKFWHDPSPATYLNVGIVRW